MTLPESWNGRLAAPIVASPMFLVSTPDLVTACCRAGIVGTIPALNHRETGGYDRWLAEIGEKLSDTDAPYGVNLVAHRSNARLDADLKVTLNRRVPLVITSLGLRPDLIKAVQAYGGLVFHDVTNMHFARKAIEAGVDGIIAVAHGAGGHAGALSPIAFLSELRAIFDGTILLGGSMSTGTQVAAAQILGADLGYLGTRFLATKESSAAEGHKQMLLDHCAADVVMTPKVSGIPANFLRPSLVAGGIDPEDQTAPARYNFGTSGDIKPWRDLWAAGQGIAAIRDVPSAGELCRRLAEEYHDAIRRIPALADDLRPLAKETEC